MSIIDRYAIAVNARRFLAGMLSLIARTFFARYDFCSYDKENEAMTDGFASIITELERIGIGGSLTAPPLPHHRTCGSASGGSAG
jgi:hypothetical protein